MGESTGARICPRLAVNHHSQETKVMSIDNVAFEWNFKEENGRSLEQVISDKQGRISCILEKVPFALNLTRIPPIRNRRMTGLGRQDGYRNCVAGKEICVKPNSRTIGIPRNFSTTLSMITQLNAPIANQVILK